MAGTWKLGTLSGKRWAALLCLVVSVLVSIAWQNGLRGPFVFDDLSSIVQSANVRRPVNLLEAAWAPPGSGANSRPLVALSLAANHAAGGLDPFGYHLVNVIAHAMCAIVLGDLARRLTRSPGFGLALAAIWCVHPLTTDAVNLVVTRNEVFVALFGLISLDAVWIAFESPSRKRIALAVALLTGLLAALSKEIAAVLPLLLVFMHLAFHRGVPLRSQWRFLAAMCLVTWAPLALLIAFGERGESVGLDLQGATPLAYWQDQGLAWVGYALSSVWPSQLLADYGPWIPNWLMGGPLFRNIALLILFVAAIGIYEGGKRFRAAAFLLIAYALWLAPSSSFLPLAGEVFAEHRAYLPSAAILALVLGTGHLLLSLARIAPRARVLIGGPVVASICVVFVQGTRARNTIWQDELTFWEDVVEKSDHARGWNSYGVALAARGQAERAKEAYAHVLELDPDHAKANNNLGNLLSVSEPLAAENHFRVALQSDPDNVEARTNLANLLRRTNRYEEAFATWKEALRLNPESTPTLLNRGEALIAIGKVKEGLEDLERALEIDPEFQAARARLAWHLAVAPEEEFRNPRRALELTDADGGGPRILDARAAALAALGYDSDAVRVAEEAARWARQRNQKQLALEIETRAALYREGRPYVQQR